MYMSLNIHNLFLDTFRAFLDKDYTSLALFVEGLIQFEPVAVKPFPNILWLCLEDSVDLSRPTCELVCFVDHCNPRNSLQGKVKKITNKKV
jgi:hypothetical protein